MTQYRFGVVRGHVNTRGFGDATFLKKGGAVSDAQNIQKLQARRADLIFIDQFVAKYRIQTRFPEFAGELEFLEPPLETKFLCIAFSKRAPGFQQKPRDFNSGLERIRKAGILKATMKKYGF